MVYDCSINKVEPQLESETHILNGLEFQYIEKIEVRLRAPASTVLWEDLPRQVGSKMNVFHSQHHYTPSLTASKIYVP